MQLIAILSFFVISACLPDSQGEFADFENLQSSTNEPTSEFTDEPTTEDPCTPTGSTDWLTSSTTRWDEGDIANNFGTQCGETLTGSEGTISYKSEEFFDTYERCLWIVRAHGKREIAFNLSNHSLGTEGVVHIATFWKHTPPYFRTYILKPGTTNVTMFGNVAVVMFASTSANGNGKGFMLDWIGMGDSADVSDLSRDYISSADWEINGGGNVTHPDNLPCEMYNDDELSVFVVATPDFKFVRDRFVRYKWQSYGMDNCYDWVWAYDFNYFQGWRARVRYCDLEGIDGEFVFGENVLYVFSSNYVRVGGGFSLSWQLPAENGDMSKSENL